MSKWKKVKFGDVVEFPPALRLVRGEEYPFVELADINIGFKYVYSKEDKEYTGSGSKFENGDTLFARITPSLENGKIAQVKGLLNIGFGSGEFFIFRGIKDVSDSDYIYYLSQTKSFQDNAINSMVGASGRQRADNKFVAKTEILFPPLPTQKKIAKILSNYDDLIENNLKRIKLLEESARLTYEEWFLRFRIDGEKLEIDSESGLPFGWEKKKLKEITSYVARGISPKYVEENGVVVLNQKCIRNNFVNVDLGRLHSLDKKVTKEKILQVGDILINSTGTGTLGRVAQVFHIVDGMTVDSHVSIVRANKLISPYILGRALEYQEEYITNLGKGATNQQELGRTDLESLVHIIIPEEKYQKKYEEYASPIFSIIKNLRNENQLLKEARDILLPRLMTGMIDVDNMEVAV